MWLHGIYVRVICDFYGYERVILIVNTATIFFFFFMYVDDDDDYTEH